MRTIDSANGVLSMMSAKARKGAILIVEDDRQIRHSLEGILKEAGYRPVPSASGEEALGYLESDAQVRCVLLDMILPPGNGWQVAEAMKKSPKWRRIPIVAMSAGRVQVPGAVAVLRKPFRPDVLLATIEEAVRDFEND